MVIEVRNSPRHGGAEIKKLEIKIQKQKINSNVKSQNTREFVGVDPCVDPINGFK